MVRKRAGGSGGGGGYHDKITQDVFVCGNVMRWW